MAKLTFSDNSERRAEGSHRGLLKQKGGGSTSVPGQSAAGAVPGMDQSARPIATKSSSGSSMPANANVPGANQEDAPSLFRQKQEDPTGPNYGYQRIRFHKADELNPYADMEDARHGLDPRARKLVVMGVVLVVVFFLSATLPTQIVSPIARTNNSLATFLRDFAMQTQGLIATLTGAESMFSSYVWEIVAAGLAGAALGLSGGVYQGAMKNALASPSTLGVTQGAALGLIIYGVFFYPGGFTGSISEYSAMLEQMGPIEYIIEVFGGFISSLIGCVIVVALCMLIAYIAGRGRVSNVSLIIAGQVFSAVIGVVISWIRYYLVEYLGDPVLTELVQTAQSATFSGLYSLTTVAVFAVPTILCMAAVFIMSPRLSLLAFNDEEARSMGVSTRLTRNVMVALCTVLTALVVSFVGMIGFVGFMVPHIARRITGPDFRYLLPACAFLGAILIVAVHYLANMGIPGFATSGMGVFTSVIGCLMFLVIALRSRGGRNADWL